MSAAAESAMGLKRWVRVAACGSAAAGAWLMLSGGGAPHLSAAIASSGVVGLGEAAAMQDEGCSRCVRRAQQHLAELSALPRSGGIEWVGERKGWPVSTKKGAVTFGKSGDDEEGGGDGQRQRSSDDGQRQRSSDEAWPKVGIYGDVPKMDGDLVDQDPTVRQPCSVNPVSVECTGGFGGGPKAHGAERAMPESGEDTLNLGAAPEIEGPHKVSSDLQDAWGYMYGFAGDTRTATRDISGPRLSAWDGSDAPK